MGGFEDWREHPRVDISGEALWSADRIEGRCRLLNLSVSGVGIVGTTPPLPIGTQLHVSLVINGRHLESVPVEVVQMSDGAMGLRFWDLDEGLRSRVESLVKELMGEG
jgi:hypothetical protein